MNRSWEVNDFLNDRRTSLSIANGLRQSLLTDTNQQYLDAISSLALDPRYTELIFAIYEDVFVEICSRWLVESTFMGNPIQILAAFARILPLAPYLSVFVRTLLRQRAAEISEAFSLSRASGLQHDSDRSIQNDLLTILRLLLLDNDDYSSLVAPAQLQLFLGHSHRPTRYLAIRIFCLYLHASEALLEKMIDQYLGVDMKVDGVWEDRIVDYSFLDLWECKRLEDLRKTLEEKRSFRRRESSRPKAIDLIKEQDWSLTTARVGNTLLPRHTACSPGKSSMVMVETTKRNLTLLGNAYIKSSNILVTGPSGAGKTSLIHDLARELGQESSMVTLHLNEQTDAKLLIGVYASDNSQGSFKWQPGILTKAVTEGRWIMVEDLDKAPPDVIGTLLPLLEGGELLIPHWGECIRAAPGFRLFATIRSLRKGKGELTTPGSNMIGFRHWSTVPMLVPTDFELAEIVKSRHPVLDAYAGRIMRVYSCIREFHYPGQTSDLKTIQLSRSYGPQDLFRWCNRLEALLMAAGVRTGHEPISEATNDSVLLEAVDCFAGPLPSSSFKIAAIGLIAKELQISTERVDFCLKTRTPEYSITASHLRLGRVCIPRRKAHDIARTQMHDFDKAPFAFNSHSLRFLETAAAAVNMAEPCLLVGETGIGKTAFIQQLAELTNNKLTVVNLSQQSEAGDLLGGFKPMNMRTLAVPMLEDFEDLFNHTFPSKRNQTYIDTVTKAVSKGRWARAVTLWQEALQKAEGLFTPGNTTAPKAASKHIPKKRRVDTSNIQHLESGWKNFATRVRTFEVHLASGSKGFAFSFVEGNIVKAVRSGHWVLLDEINLASSDTLESIADLLSQDSGNGPSILLSETGDVNRIRAHKDFRLFGAMNPATDVGKRDLPASFRSRFTEIFIDPPEDDHEDLVSIVKVYLGSLTHVDPRAPSDIATTHLEIKRLARQNLLVDGSGQKPHFSLRTLTRTLVYVSDIAHTYGFRRALYEGFCMSFLTVLNAESATLVISIIEKHLLRSQKNSQAFLRQIPRAPEGKANYVRFKHYWMPQGTFPAEEQPHFIITPFVERNLLNLVRATMTRKFPVLLQGPTSSGKTSMVEYLAKISGNKFVRINNHEHTDLQEYLGTYVSGIDGRLQYKEGVLIRALREGSWIVLDELNLAPTDVLEALNRLLDDNRELMIPETQQVVRPHKNFMLFATQNPPGMYGGRKVLSRAFRNRFLELHFDDIPEEDLETILRGRCQIAPSFCTRIVAVYKRLSVLRQTGRLFEQRNSFATLRDLFRWALRNADDREQLAVNGFMLLAERVRNSDERKAVKEIIEEVMNVCISENLVYGKDKARRDGFKTGMLESGIVWTKSLCRLYVLVAEAFKNNEPVLLVGETGSGKTTICQIIAERMRTHLHTINAHQNLETGDLIGSQRPIRNKDAINSQLAQELAEVLELCSQNGDDACQRLPALLETYDALSSTERDSIPQEWQTRVDSSRIRSAALFEWMDGSLVHAMKAGQHFLLDEISLADDAVLERLNSLLEPARTVFLAEKGTDDTPVIASPGFQFCATMNPGGDYGKKELSPALRNRFTEIWVPNLDDEHELLEIARDKLASRWAQYAEPIIAFGTWFSSHYHLPTPSHSVRHLLAWILFLNDSDLTDDYLVILHGAATVYVDSLGADPAAKLSIPANEVSKARYACLQQLSVTFKHDMVSIYDTQYVLSVGNGKLAIGPFHLSLNDGAFRDPGYSLEAPTTKANTLRIIRGLRLPKPILLEGSPGVGKTTLVATIAATAGIPLTRINLSDQTDLMDLFGSDVPLEGASAGSFGWQQAPFLRSMQRGEWVLLDEMNLASQSVLEGLNACLDHRGEVYVSELDQTFLKHPNFVLFAAQNPRHQGGGRKGLPSSFVNRFTVVCIDEFTPQDQLMICNRAFPSCSDQILTTVTQCVAAVSALLRSDLTVGTQGGPWEFNLRDDFRWLYLITSHYALLPAGSTADYHDLLILQRLRSTGEAISVSRLLSNKGTHANANRQLFSLVGTCFLQVGLGLLSRSTTLCYSKSPQHFRNVTSLAHLESIMLCIQNRWPCLLVGSSGSGKTHAIMQLANMVGAKLVTIHLNADMDTTDLVGGYLQADPQRELTTFLHSLRESLRKVVIERFLVDAPKASCLYALEDCLQAESPDPPQLITLLRDCAKEVAKPELSSFADELNRIMLKDGEDKRGRFEWVDGILVKALREGSWLVLDNANLCSSSVLDRLNSLLEPNGVLMVNERRSSDGSAHVVKPHPSFRLFMTSNPRYGELSRAMRNRSVELYLPAFESPSDCTIGLAYVSTSRLARYRMLERFQWDSMTDAFTTSLLEICLDHLTLMDLPSKSAWTEQVVRGLLPLQSRQVQLFSSVIELYDRMINASSTMFSSIQAGYENLARSLRMDLEWCEYSKTQTLHPMNNPALVQISLRDNKKTSLSRLGSLFESSLALCRMDNRLERLKESATTKLPSQMSLLEKSFALNRKGALEPTSPIGVLLQKTQDTIRKYLNGIALEQSHQSTLDIVDGLLNYLNDFADAVEAPESDEGVLQSYLTLGKALADQLRGTEAMEIIGEAFSHGLERFNDMWQLSSGQSMEALWLLYDSGTAENLQGLELRLQVEELSNRFDRLNSSYAASMIGGHALRDSLLQLSETISRADALGDPLQGIRTALESVESYMKTYEEWPESAWFRSEFEGLCQYKNCASTSKTVAPDVILEMLASRPTILSMRFGPSTHAYESLISIGKCTGISSCPDALAPIRGVVAMSILQKINISSEIPLKFLGSVRDEINVLASRVASSIDSLDRTHQQTIDSRLRVVLQDVMKLHEDVLDPTTSSEFREQLATQLSAIHLPQSAPLLRPCTNSLDKGHVQTAINDYFNPALQQLHLTLRHQDDEASYRTTTNSGLAWIQVFTGLLTLYLPDRPFDPASKSLVQRDRHRKRKTELQNKLDALTIYERAFTGQTSSLRYKVVQQKLQDLGLEPQVRAIVRPRKSNLAALQAVFNGIVISVVKRLPSGNALQALCEGGSTNKTELQLLRSNVALFISRLSDDFRAYDDITDPLVAMLRGLDVGLAMVTVAHSRAKSRCTSASFIYKCTPLLGMRPDYAQDRDNVLRSLDDLGSRLTHLKMVGLMGSVSSISKDRMMPAALEMLHVFYTEWKEQLSESQRKSATKTSLYRYRGTEEDQEESFDDLMAMFSEDDTLPTEATKAHDTKTDPRQVAQSLAHAQQELFSSIQSTSQRILRMVKDAGRRLGDVKENMAEEPWCELPTERLLPALILRLDEAREALRDKELPGKTYNFYTDAHFVESQKLLSLLRKIQERFNDLQADWPENATIGDVRRTCNELLDTRHTEPIARLLTKSDQLHGYMHEWQVVASREYSAIVLYDQLTDLLISWRRLELSTWARLLDIEDQQCSRDVEAWWFIAYEVIVAAPLSIAHAGQEMAAHTEHLLETLTDFLRTTSKGHFVLRLQMIECFVKHVELLARDVHPMKLIAHALQNFLSFYGRYTPSIQESVKKGRQALEKDMKEILLMATWKDTNINALRDSAKRSHHRLYKVIRKYRALLAQPVQQILEQGLPDARKAQPNVLVSDPAGSVLFIDPEAFRTCDNIIPGWAAKPVRLKEPMVTARKMAQVTTPSASSVDCAMYLDDYASIFIETIKSLQRETPNQATKSNNDVVKHLKTRKRKVFTDALRDMRQMGFKQHMNESALAKQASSSKILAETPVTSNLRAYSKLETAEMYFHKLLDLLPRVRNSAREHSGDLNPGEVSRSIGYLESILSIILKQRAILTGSITGHGRLVETIDAMEGLWTVENHDIRRAALMDRPKSEKVVERLQWLPGLLEAGSIILEKHAKLGDIDNTTVIAGLEGWHTRTRDILDAYKSLARLPEGLSSSLHDGAIREAEGHLGKLKADLQAWTVEYPKAAFVLREIEPWTIIAFERREQTNGVATISLAEVDQQISQASDAALIAAQRVRAALETLPMSIEDSAWLIKADKSLTEALKSFDAANVAQLLTDAMNNMQHVTITCGNELKAATAAIALALPIVRQYFTIQQETIHRYIESHHGLCKLASVLAQSLSQLFSQGFCSPPAHSDSDSGKTENLEGGTGLGEGEGVEDISKDVQDDEDLSELAQGVDRNKDREDIEDEEDAVDMDHDELEGEPGDGSKSDEGEVSGDEDGNDDLDEETGKVDELDAGAVDEKLWDGSEEGPENEKEGSKGTGKMDKDEQMASKGKIEDEKAKEESIEEDENMSDGENGDAEEVARGAAEKLDPHLQEQGRLDLPEEMDLDRDNDSTMSELQGSDLGEDLESDAGADEPEEQVKDVDDGEEEDRAAAYPPTEAPEDAEENEAKTNDAGSPVDTEPEDDEPDRDQGLLGGQMDNAAASLDDAAPSDAQQGGQDLNRHDDDDEVGQSGTKGTKGEKPCTSTEDDSQGAAKEGDLERADGKQEDGLGDDPASSESARDQAFKKLGDALEQWHRQHRKIRDATDEQTQPKATDAEMMDPTFEHLRNEDAEADTQALGAATEEQAHALDQRALDTEMKEPQDDFLRDEVDPEAIEGEEDRAEPEAYNTSANRNEQSKPSAFIGPNHIKEPTSQEPTTNDIPDSDTESDSSMSDAPASPSLSVPPPQRPRSPTASNQLWGRYSTLTTALSQTLTEQLRLILTPTHATKMRGDFRTGKRLNIKRIIPYIASNYKRDKIWMRRSVPQKRSYQIMLAVDDSKSMAEGGGGELALQALVCVSQSLTMLEVGEVSVVGFGEEVKVAHAFDKPLDGQAGGQILQQLTFRQTRTNVRKLIEEAITLFQEAKVKAPSSSSSTEELWQLLLIMSDGLCEDHDTIKRLVRQAQEEKIMIVFLIVDGVRGESIVDMSQAVFEDDGEGGQKLRIKRYLEGFPFMYYLVVGDVKELPGVLATALRQWFSEVVGTG